MSDEKKNKPNHLLDKVPTLKELTRNRQHFVVEKALGKTDKDAVAAAFPNMSDKSQSDYASILKKDEKVKQALHEIMIAKYPDFDGAIATALYDIVTNKSKKEKSSDIINAAKTVISTRPGGLAPKESVSTKRNLNIPGRTPKDVTPEDN